jgi:carboxypeptidase C (cathepsin A)
VAPATLLRIGPRSLRGDKAAWEIGQQLTPPYEMVDNPDTWLTMTDLVLIDPEATDYSRATNPKYTAQYYNPDADARSIAQFIQLYLQRYAPAMRQSIFVGGESYGSVRSATRIVS